jgi:SAM-dependent methyltransferase
LNPVKRGDFRTLGRAYADYCRTLCRLGPGHRLLDLGCGAGPLAVALLGYLSPPGSYEGLDILPDAVAWCRHRITSHFPHFRFQLVDVANRDYNPAGSLDPNEYRLPYPDAHFDVVQLRSVFTHMGPREVHHYLRQIARVLRPEGRCLTTFNLLNPESLELMRRVPVRQFPDEHREFVPVEGGRGAGEWVAYRVSEPGNRVALAHFEENVRRSIVASGLRVVEPIRYGRWCGRCSPWCSQDIVVMEHDPYTG